jgi:hypothetical protein
LHFRGGRNSISKDVYPDLHAFFEDLGRTYRKAVKAFYDAGCRYLQFDDTVWAYLCSQDELNKARERGDGRNCDSSWNSRTRCGDSRTGARASAALGSFYSFQRGHSMSRKASAERSTRLFRSPRLFSWAAGAYFNKSAGHLNLEARQKAHSQ